MDQCINYVGRLDYPGKDELTDSERDKIDAFIKDQAEEAKDIVYCGKEIEIFNVDIYRLLWGLEMRQCVFEGYVEILNNMNMTKIWCMSAHATSAILTALQGQKFVKGSKKKVKQEDMQALDNVMSVSVGANVRLMLGQLKVDVLEGNRYIIFPLNTKNHWHMVVLDTKTKEFKRLNSMLSPVSIGHSKIWAKFIRLYLMHVYNYQIPSDEVGGQLCPHQGEESLDCGAFFCLFAECFARDDPAFWNESLDLSISYYRAHLVATILSSKDSIYCD